MQGIYSHSCDGNDHGMSGVGSGYPDSLCPGTGAYEEACKKELLPRQKQIFMQEKLPVIAQEAEKNVPDELGLPEGKFFVAVVGNRL